MKNTPYTRGYRKIIFGLPQNFRPQTHTIALCICMYAAILFSGCGSAQKGSKKQFTKENDPHLEKPQPMGSDLRVKIDYYYVEAATQAALMNIPEAVALYKEVLKIDPANHAAMYEISRLLLSAGKISEALPYAEKSWQLNTSNYWYGQQAAEVYVKLNKFTEAEKVLLKMADKFPEDKEVRINLADLYLRSGQNDKALKSLDQLEKVAGESSEINLQRFRIYAGSSRQTEARAELRKLIRANPENTDYYRYLYDYFQILNMPDSATTVLEDLLKADPSNAFGLITLSQNYKASGRDKEASELQARALNSEGLTPDGKLQLLLAISGTLTQDSGLYDAVSEMTDKLLLEMPSSHVLLALRADLYRMKNNLDSARVYLLRSLELEGNNESLWENLLYLDATLQNYDLLFSDSEKALDFFPNSQAILYMQGVSAFSLKKFEDSKYALEKALKLTGNNQEQEAGILSTLGEVYHNLGEHSLSDQTFEKALQLNPDNATLLNNYAYYLSLRSIELEKASQMVQKALKLEPGTPSFEDTYGWILYQQGKYPEAQKLIQSAYDKSPSPDVAEHLGDVYFKLGNAAKAVEFWTIARELGIKSPALDKKISDGKL